MTRGRRALSLVLQLATLELKLDAFVFALERWYRPDQPRAPRGTPIGGQWIDDVADPDRTVVAARRPRSHRRCDGFAAGCQNGGTFGNSGSVDVFGKRLCWDCAIKFLGVEDFTPSEQLELIRKIDPIYRSE